MIIGITTEFSLAHLLAAPLAGCALKITPFVFPEEGAYAVCFHHCSPQEVAEITAAGLIPASRVLVGSLQIEYAPYKPGYAFGDSVVYADKRDGEWSLYLIQVKRVAQ